MTIGRGLLRYAVPVMAGLALLSPGAAPSATAAADLDSARPAPEAVAAASAGSSYLVPPAQLARASVPPGWPTAPAATATAYVLLDAETGQVLAERRAHERRPVASTVKVLTALTVLERADPEDEVVIGAEVSGIGGAGVGLAPGDVWTVEQLLEGLVVRSGNDAAVALATYVGGSVDAFMELMRQDAAALGVDGLVLASPSGLFDENRLSALDLATITRAAMRHPGFRNVAARETVTLPGQREMPSRNELLGRYPGATGVKTGYTDAAGWSLVAAAERNGHELIAVVLDSVDADARFTDAMALLDHGFGDFLRVRHDLGVRLRRAGSWIDVPGRAVSILVPAEDPATAVDLPLPVAADTSLAIDARISWHGAELAAQRLSAAAPSREPADGTPELGRWLMDQGYAAMRAAAAADLWSGSTRRPDE